MAAAAAAAAVASSFILSKSIIFPSSFRPLLPSNKRSVCPRKAAAGRPSPRRSIVASAAATIDSSNGVVSATVQKPIDSAEYGRQFFPLAAVVGQVHKCRNFLLSRALLCHRGTLAPSSSPAAVVAPKR
ncbi:hypothetical protein BHE74_00034030 [Ensete ventricosum]|nr:hypothetical protein BHE74_00034030 [Ensete ventricosum]